MTAPLAWANMKKPETRLFKAYATGARSNHADTHAETPRGAALNFFKAHPTKRKCDVIECWDDGVSLVIKFGNPWPKSWKGVTRKTANTLPATLTGE